MKRLRPPRSSKCDAPVNIADARDGERPRRPFKALRELLRAHGPAAECIERIGAQQNGAERELEAARALLPPEMRPHCVAAARSGERLTLTLDSPAWATRARYLAESITAAADHKDAEDRTRSVRIRVQPARGAPLFHGAPGPAAGVIRRLPQGVVEHLLASADDMEDPKLAEALRRLARRHEKD